MQIFLFQLPQYQERHSKALTEQIFLHRMIIALRRDQMYLIVLNLLAVIKI